MHPPKSPAPAASPIDLRGDKGCEQGAAVGFSVGIFLMAAVLWVHQAAEGWTSQAMTGHQFRQSQTALTAAFMSEDGFRLDYSTPVLGKPWSIPMEFPLYQFLISQWADWGGQNIVISGRWVSALMFWVGVVALFLILRGAGFGVGAGLLMCGVVITTPVYWFYGRAVLIESTAWAASLWFLWALLAFRSNRMWRFLGLSLVFGGLAVLVMPTSWAVVCLVWASLWLRDLINAKQRNWRNLLTEAGGIGLPLLLIGFAWVAYSDQVKSANPIAHFLTSDQLVGFNFGTIEDKTSWETWSRITDHWFKVVLAPWALLVGLGFALIIPRARSLCLLGLVCFGAIQVLFTNLYQAHDYYFFANAFCLIFAATVGPALWWETPGAWWKHRLVSGVVFVGLIVSQVGLYRQHLHEQQSDKPPPLAGLAVAVNRVSSPNDVVVMHARDWESSLAFYADRRMLMIPDSQMYYHPDRVERSLSLLRDESVAVLLAEGEALNRPEWVARTVSQLGMWPEPVFDWFGNVWGYVEPHRVDDVVELLRADLPHGITILPTTYSSEPDPELQLARSDFESDFGFLDELPEKGVFPYGAIVDHSVGAPAVLVHAPTQLSFARKPTPGNWSFEIQMNPSVYGVTSFDGVVVVAELRQGGLPIQTVGVEFIDPASGPQTYLIEVEDLTALEGFVTLRVLPGIAGNAAFDQALLLQVSFTAQEEDQTTSAK